MFLFLFLLVNMLVSGYIMLTGILILNNTTCKIPLHQRSLVILITLLAFVDLFFCLNVCLG